MPNPNLVKSNWTVNSEESRVIDNSALLEERLLQYQEEQQRLAEMNMSSFEEPEEEFVGGLDAEQLEQLTADQTVYGSPDMEGVEGDFDEAQDMDDGAAQPMPQRAPQQNIAAMSNEALQQAQEQADELLANAQEEANRIVADAENAANQLKESARQEGYDAGYAEGRDTGKAEVAAEAEEEYQTRLRQLDLEYQNLVDKLEPEMVDTLTRIYEHVFDVNLRDEKKIILHLLQTTLSRIEPGDDFIIHVSSTDYDAVQDEKEHLKELIANPNATLELIEDPLLNQNECMVETEGGIFDCSLGAELTELSRKIKLLAMDRRRN